MEDFNITSPKKWNDTQLSKHASIDYELYQKYYRNQNVSDTAYWSLMIAYTLLILVGSIGNFLVILAVINNKGTQI